MAAGQNILFLDFIPHKKCGMVQALQDLSYTVVCPESCSDESPITDNTAVILCRVDSSVEPDDAFPAIMRHRDASGAAVAILASNGERRFFLDSMRRGIQDFILLPCSMRFLSSAIAKIIDDGGASDSGMRLHREGASRSMDSFLDNSLHQNRLVRHFIDRRPILHSLSRDADVFDDLETAFDDNDTLQSEMAAALEKGEFELYYQPVISLRDDKLYSFETLIRWRHGEKGMILPDDFIPAAEASPIIVPLGYWIVEEAARRIQQWCSRGLCSGLRLNVNLSARQFNQPDLSDRIIGITDGLGVDPVSLGFEITESAFMEDMEAANMNLLKLRAKGFRIYMDDFGTGYASLSYLLHFPVDCIKIDKSFVQWMHIDEQSLEIVRSVISLAHNLKQDVVAEGVETREHIAMLKDLECDFIQGFFVSHPLDSSAAEEFIRKNVIMT